MRLEDTAEQVEYSKGLEGVMSDSMLTAPKLSMPGLSHAAPSVVKLLEREGHARAEVFAPAHVSEERIRRGPGASARDCAAPQRRC